jgi:uncharacterized protein (TIGR02118 family)
MHAGSPLNSSNQSSFITGGFPVTKLVAIYKQPPDPEAFDEAYFKTHLPLLAKVPGLQRTALTRFKRTIQGDQIYLMAEMYFSDSDALKAGLRSPEMAAAGENLNSFAEGLVMLAFGEEETSGINPPAGSTPTGISA